MKLLSVFSSFVVILLLTGAVSAAPTESIEIVDHDGLVYDVSFDSESEKIIIQVSNPTTRQELASTYVNVDDGYSKKNNFHLEPGKNITYSYNLTKGVDVRRTNHTVQFSAWSETVWFNYTRDINPRSTSEYPTVSISDVQIESQMHRGESRSYINVTGVNPSGRFRVFEMRVHTLETSDRGILTIPPNSTSNATLVLNEPAGELVVGEVRLYDGNVSSEADGFEQVEVYGRSTGDTDWYEEEYQAVDAPWGDDPYKYENESVHREKIGAPETVYESPVIWILTAVVGLFVLRKLNRLRK